VSHSANDKGCNIPRACFTAIQWWTGVSRMQLPVAFPHRQLPKARTVVGSTIKLFGSEINFEMGLDTTIQTQTDSPAQCYTAPPRVHIALFMACSRVSMARGLKFPTFKKTEAPLSTKLKKLFLINLHRCRHRLV
jgi:hypothetical protein